MGIPGYMVCDIPHYFYLHPYLYPALSTVEKLASVTNVTARGQETKC